MHLQIICCITILQLHHYSQNINDQGYKDLWPYLKSEIVNVYQIIFQHNAMKFISLFLDGDKITDMFNPYYRDLQSQSLVWLQLMNMSVYQILSKSLGNGDSFKDCIINKTYRTVCTPVWLQETLTLLRPMLSKCLLHILVQLKTH